MRCRSQTEVPLTSLDPGLKRLRIIVFVAAAVCSAQLPSILSEYRSLLANFTLVFAVTCTVLAWVAFGLGAIGRPRGFVLAVVFSQTISLFGTVDYLILACRLSRQEARLGNLAWNGGVAILALVLIYYTVSRYIEIAPRRRDRR